MMEQLVAVIRKKWRRILAVFILFMALLCAGMAYGISYPERKAECVQQTRQSIKQNPFYSLLDEALRQRNLLLLAAAIFINNLLIAALLASTLLGMLCGISLAFMGYQAFLTGLVYAPTSLEWGILLALAMPVILLEFGAYSVACVAGIDVFLSALKPSWIHSEGVGRREGVRLSFKELMLCYVPIALILIVSALLEASIIVFFVK